MEPQYQYQYQHQHQQRRPKSPIISTTTAISNFGTDILENIFKRLPAKSFALASCVNRLWNSVCTHILSHPKLSSAISLSPNLPDALNEVVGKVYSEPIKPQFAVLCVCPAFSLDEAHWMVVKKLGCGIVVVSCCAEGIIGRDAVSDQFRELKFSEDEVNDVFGSHISHGGISLTVGYMPGLRVNAIPLIQTTKGPSIDDFVMDIRNYSTNVSGSTSPESIILFGDHQVDMKPVLQKLDYALSQKTGIAGNESCHFKYTSIYNPTSSSMSLGGPELSYGAVALVFAREKTKSDGDGRIDFHLAIGPGVIAIGPTYKVVSAKPRSHEAGTWLTAKREGENGTLDGQQLFQDIEAEVPDVTLNADLYIGVTKKRKCSVALQKVKPVKTVVYHPILGGDEQYLYISGSDVKTGDLFRFYVPDSEFALPSSVTISGQLAELKQKEIIGGFIFACCGRGATFFQHDCVDSSPVLDNFPSVPVGGMFCQGEIGRGSQYSVQTDEDQEEAAQSYLHVYSSVYLLMSYSSPHRQ